MEVLNDGEEMECLPSYLDEYQKLVVQINDTPRVVIDNTVSPTVTVVKVDSARKHEILLESIQALTDLNLCISKAYISSDGRWFMGVFHVTDEHGRKVTNNNTISSIEHSLGAKNHQKSNLRDDLAALELTGADRPGLLSEVFAVLADHHCSVAEAKVWTHNGRIASLIFLNDSTIRDSGKMQGRLHHVLQGHCVVSSAASLAHVDRRLHQMMYVDVDANGHSEPTTTAPLVTVQNWVERGYSVVSVQCRDRPKLMFDVVCALTDMELDVFHGTVDTKGNRAHMEFYIRRSNGTLIESDAERKQVNQCLQAAIERRSFEGLRVELRAINRLGLLADVTRGFRENGLLLVRRAEVSTEGDMVCSVFYITDAGGRPATAKMIDAVWERERIGTGCLQVMESRRMEAQHRKATARGQEGVIGGRVGVLYLGSMIIRNLYKLGVIRFCS